MPEPKITATLKNAHLITDGRRAVYVGEIYGDTHKRWADGTYIRTSQVKREEGDLVYTLNSVYKIEPIDKNED